MNTLRSFVLAIAFLCFLPVYAEAGDFDGSKPLIGAVIDVYECVSNGSCEQVTVEELNFVRFLEINFQKKEITGTRANGQLLTSKIKSKGSMFVMLVLQGVEDGKGWTLAISETTGKMVLTISGDDEGFVVFGACMAR